MPDGGRPPEGPGRWEDAFALVEGALHGPQTLGGALDRLAGFVAAVADDAALEPYLLGVVDRLAARAAPGGHDPLELAGLEPARLDALADRLAALDASPPLREALDGVGGHLARLRARLWAWVEGAGAGSWPGLCVPVVERDGETPARGALRAVRVGLQRSDGPETFTVGSAVYGRGAGRAAFRTARSAARALLAADHPGLAVPATAGSVQFGMATAGHEGDSADLAVAALYALELHALAAPEAGRRFVPGVVVTGRIAADGAVLPVDGATLALKVRAAFLSPAAVLVVPAAQRAAAERARAALAAAHPARRLPVVGALHLRDVVGEGLTEPAPRPRPAAGPTWRTAALGAALVALAVLLGAGARALAVRPAGVAYADGAMVVEGRFGTALDAVPLAPGLGAWLAAGPAEADGHAALFDVDDDGAREVVWWDLRPADGAFVVKVKRPGAAALTWETALPDVQAGPGPEASAAPLTEVAVGGSTGIRGGTTVYVWVSEAGAPTPSIVVLDGVTGQRLSAWVPAE